MIIKQIYLKDGETVKKRFFITQIIVFILLTACLVGVTYSWSTRSEVKGGFMSTPMKLTYSSVVNGNECTAKTYLGTLNTTSGKIEYPENVDDAIESVAKVTRSEGDVLYFKTVITNPSLIDTNVTFLIDANTDSGNKSFTIGTTSPVLKEITYDSSAEGKWIPVVSQYEILKEHEAVSIEWYVQINTSGSFGIDAFALANN